MLVFLATIFLLSFGSVCYSQNALNGYLEAHNNKRRNVSPSASNMRELKWSDELARIAKRYSERCVWEHNRDRSIQSQTYQNVGENLYVHSNDQTPETVVSEWDSEKADYTYSTGRCRGVCGHYTQVVWADTEFVGCGKTYCSSIQNLGYSGYFVVCNYGPAGNVLGQRPYKNGAPCTDCPSGYICSNNLCVA